MMTSLLKICLIVILTACIHSTPIAKSTEEYEAELKQKRQTIETLDSIYDNLQEMVTNNLKRMYHKITALSLAYDQLEEKLDQQELGVSTGAVGDMTNRCRENFKAVPGDNTCYYLSTYKAPWMLAREHCMQLGGDVEMLSIRTTKRQFTVSHLIQSDPEAKQVKKWWTSGRANGYSWAWAGRSQTEEYFYKFWANDNDGKPDTNSCTILDREYYYQWRTVKQCIDSQNTKSIAELPAHHFICQQPAYELPTTDSK